MPRPALAKVSTASLQAELERRAAKLGKLLKLREQVDLDIAELQAIADQFGSAAAADAPVVKPVRRYRRRKAKRVKVVGGLVVVNPVAKTDKRSQYDQTADQFVLGLLAGGKVLTSAELGEAWAAAGRKGAVAKTLGKLVAEEKLARRKIRGKKGSNYKLAGSAGSQAKTVTVKPVAMKPVAKKPTKRKKFAVTAGQFILDLLKGKILTGRRVNEAWKKAGRGAVADSDLSILVKAGKIKREKLGGKLGSNYSLV